MSRRKRRGGSSKLAKWGIGVGVLVALLLAANLTWGVLPMLTEDKPDPEGFLPPNFFLAVAYWLPVGGGMALCLLGAFFATRAHAENESRTVLWLRRSLLAGFAGLAGFVAATFQQDLFDREHLAAVAGWALLLAVVPTTMGAWRAYAAATRSRGKGRRKRKPHPSMTHNLEDAQPDSEERESAPVDA